MSPTASESARSPSIGSRAFVDPKLKDHYAPFGIQAIGDHIFVSYAKEDSAAEDEIAGRGRGFVDEYDLQGILVARVAHRGQLNAPWGLALAPPGFGRFSNDLLVGNFGDGEINAYEEQDKRDFEHRGTLRDADGKKLTIDGLWALEFGNASRTAPRISSSSPPAPTTRRRLFGTITAG